MLGLALLGEWGQRQQRPGQAGQLDQGWVEGAQLAAACSVLRLPPYDAGLRARAAALWEGEALLQRGLGGGRAAVKAEPAACSEAPGEGAAVKREALGGQEAWEEAGLYVSRPLDQQRRGDDAEPWGSEESGSGRSSQSHSRSRAGGTRTHSRSRVRGRLGHRRRSRSLCRNIEGAGGRGPGRSHSAGGGPGGSLLRSRSRRRSSRTRSRSRSRSRSRADGTRGHSRSRSRGLGSRLRTRARSPSPLKAASPGRPEGRPQQGGLRGRGNPAHRPASRRSPSRSRGAAGSGDRGGGRRGGRATVAEAHGAAGEAMLRAWVDAAGSLDEHTARDYGARLVRHLEGLPADKAVPLVGFRV